MRREMIVFILSSEEREKEGSQGDLRLFGSRETRTEQSENLKSLWG